MIGLGALFLAPVAAFPVPAASDASAAPAPAANVAPPSGDAPAPPGDAPSRTGVPTPPSSSAVPERPLPPPPVAVLPPRTAGPPPSAPPSVPAPESRRSSFPFRLAAGANYGALFTVPVYGAEVSVAIGGRRHEARTGWFVLDLERERTQYGLGVWGVHGGPALEWSLGALRVGGELRVGYLAVQRITTGNYLDGVSVGAAVRVSVDVVPVESGAFFAAAEGRADWYGDPLMPSGHLSIGYRSD